MTELIERVGARQQSAAESALAEIEARRAWSARLGEAQARVGGLSARA
jgi:hypothetical protein